MANNIVASTPTNIGNLFRIMADAEAIHMGAIDINIDTLWDPYKCPLELLPFLAWALSVDNWDDDWPEEIKRNVVAAAPEVHRKKGTVYAVEKALDAFDMSYKIVEWWQQEPIGRRGTFNITVYVGTTIYNSDVILDAKTQILAKSAIKASKPKSRTFTFELGVGYENQIGAGNAMSGVQAQHQTICADRDTDFHDTLGAGNSLAAAAIQHHTIEADRDSGFGSHLDAGNAMSTILIMHVTFAT